MVACILNDVAQKRKKAEKASTNKNDCLTAAVIINVNVCSTASVFDVDLFADNSIDCLQRFGKCLMFIP